MRRSTGFGVGTSLTTSADAPTLDCVYKLQEYAGLPRRKQSAKKATWPGRKQVWRRYDADGRMIGDLLGVEGDVKDGQPLIEPVMQDGKRLRPAPSLDEIRQHAKRELQRLPAPLRALDPAMTYPVTVADELKALAAEFDRRLQDGEMKTMNEGATIGGNDVLIVIDVQNDFCPGGALAVPRGDEVVPIVNRLAARFRNVVLTQDWHPHGHFSFASSHVGKKPFETIAASYGPQVLWPDHCVQGTPGAAFHPALDIPHAALVLRKGMEPTIDSYSAFYENDRKTPTGLVGYLRERGLSRVFIAGLAFDFCVRYSAEDAQREGFTVFVVEDACRGIDVDGSVAATRASLATLGVACISALAAA